MSFLDSIITSYYKDDKQSYYKNKELVKKHNELISSCDKFNRKLKTVIDNGLDYDYEVIYELQENILQTYNTIKNDKVFLAGYIYNQHKGDVELFIERYFELIKLEKKYKIIYNISRLSNSCKLFNEEFKVLQKQDNIKPYLELKYKQDKYQYIYLELIKWEKQLTKQIAKDMSEDVIVSSRLFLQEYKCFKNIMDNYEVVFYKNINEFMEANFKFYKIIKNINYKNYGKYSCVLKNFSELYSNIVRINDINNYYFISEMRDYVISFKAHYEKLNKICNVYRNFNDLVSIDKDSEAGINNFKKLLEKNIYIDHLLQLGFKEKYFNLYNQVVKNYNLIMGLELTEYKFEHISRFKEIYANYDQIIKEYNLSFVKSEKIAYKHIFQNVEGKVLDDQQMEGIIKDEINNLVIAGAGSGKTTTIIGKIEYLLEKGLCSPEQLLVISFTNATANELYGRVASETETKNIDVMTFHKLGLKIISAVEGLKPDTFDSNIELLDFVCTEFKLLTGDLSYLMLVNEYFLSYLKPYKSRFDVENEGQFIKYLKNNRIHTLKNEPVKSIEEMEISNFLFINNIEYEYEKAYEFDTQTKDHSQYKPDFYLPEYGIYIEHFGIDRNNNVPNFFKGKSGISAQRLYTESIKWKRETHKNNHTTLIETFSYEKKENNLIELLKEKLLKKGVEFKKIKTDEEIWEIIKNRHNYEANNIHKLITTFINQLKANNLGINDVEEIIEKNSNLNEKSRNKAFLCLVAPIFSRYENMLKENKKIDFNDMISKATKYVEEKKFKNPYTYIIIDEYQDISKARYNLVKAIKELSICKTYCVGDDWQSIFRFTGVDLNLFLNFEDYFGFTEKSYIEKTYRFNKSIIALTSKFILQNAKQINKNLIPTKSEEKVSYKIMYGNTLDDLKQLLKKILGVIPLNSTVALISRYGENNDLNPYLDKDLICISNYNNKNVIIKYKYRNDLEIKFYTIHGSKGLEADYVVILNNSDDRLGFPSIIEDDPVLKICIQNMDDYEFAEERRLFYVAMTRAKRFTYLMVQENHESVFIKEIEGEENLNNTSKIPKCPLCIEGNLVYKESYSFYGCSNYPYCEYKRR